MNRTHLKEKLPTARGMTLIELMVTVAIAGILASISIYSFGNGRQRSECYGTIRELRVLLSEARQQAQSTGMPVFLRFQRLPGLGSSLDGGGKIYVRWERMGCTDGQNDSWSGCPAPACRTSGTLCSLDDSGNLTEAGAANRACCESFGSWIEVADTFRIAQAGQILTAVDEQNPLNRLCWSGSDSVSKVVLATNEGQCAFDDANIADILAITVGCVDKADISSTDIAALIEGQQGDGTISIDALTGLSRIVVP